MHPAKGYKTHYSHNEYSEAFELLTTSMFLPPQEGINSDVLDKGSNPSLVKVVSGATG